MIDTCRQFATKHPSLTLLICGVVMSVLPVGLAMNMPVLITFLMEHRLIPDQSAYRHIWWYICALMTAVSFTGFALIGLSGFVAVRRWANNRH